MRNVPESNRVDMSIASLEDTVVTVSRRHECMQGRVLVVGKCPKGFESIRL